MGIYLDYNATTPIDKRVLDYMVDVYTNKFGNADSRTHDFGDGARKIVEQARKDVASLLGVDSTEVFFTSGSTESSNIAIRGLIDYANSVGKKHVITTSIEHKAVLETVKSLKNEGFSVDIDLLAGVAAETDERVGSHRLEIVLGVVDIEKELLLVDGTFAMYPILTRTDTVDEVITDEAVQGVATVLEVLIVFAGIIRIGLIIDLLGVLLQVFEIVDAMGTIDGIGLHEGRKLEVAMVWIPGLTLLRCGSVVGRSVRYCETLSSDSRVGVNGISLINIFGQ